MSKYPPGYRFNPTDEELIKNYLLPRICKNSLPAVDIPTVAINKYSPETLIREFRGRERFMQNELIMFANRSQKYSKGHRPNRSTAGGFWKPTGSYKEITDGKGRIIGRKTHLDYYEGFQGGGRAIKTPWKMHEYSSYSTNDKNSRKFQELVLYKIYLNSRHKDSKHVNNENMGVSNSSQIVEEETRVGYVQSANNNNNNMAIIENPTNNNSNGHGLPVLSSTELAYPSVNNFSGDQSSQTWSFGYPDHIDFNMNNHAQTPHQSSQTWSSGYPNIDFNMNNQAQTPHPSSQTWNSASLDIDFNMNNHAQTPHQRSHTLSSGYPDIDFHMNNHAQTHQNSQTRSSGILDINFHMNNHTQTPQSNEPAVRFAPLMDISPILGCPISYNTATDHN